MTDIKALTDGLVEHARLAHLGIYSVDLERDLKDAARLLRDQDALLREVGLAPREEIAQGCGDPRCADPNCTYGK